ncbi:HAD-IB family hydrolase [Nocardia arizonensis]|uniref:HAD-IB family hydrolase n=1 Tax=Nocardia arizonensis TaxID=1141647 RepID=UPI0006D0CF8B|nr:HAD-IB family hydrolase [Nocardia arizonensis]
MTGGRGAPGDLPAMLAAIRTGPQGPRVAAFFDFAGAVVDGYAGSRRYRRRGSDDARTVLRDGIRGNLTDGEYSRFLQHASHALGGRTEADLDALGANLFRRTIYGRVYPEAWRLISTHRAAGHTVVLTSPLTRFQVRPAAEALGVGHVLCTTMATEDGVLTGHVEGKTRWRSGMVDAVRAFAAEHDVDLDNSYAYADADADLPLLGAVGHPVAVGPTRALEVAAAEHDWPVLTFRPRRTPGIGDIARTVLAFAALLAGAVAGVLSKVHTRRRRDMADALMDRGASATLRVLGVRLRVVGGANARSPRPAVFLFNHQSQFDVIIVPKVLGGGVTGIGKKELTRNPVFGPLMRFVGVTFIDRAHTATAKAQLAPVIGTLRGGLSIAMAPEGTRSYTPEVGPFKKGAFHIAHQAGVPVIPVVIRNAGEISWRNSMVARRGTVDVAILDPIDVSAWDPAAMDAEVEEVRQRYLRTLLDWPSTAERSTP